MERATPDTTVETTIGKELVRVTEGEGNLGRALGVCHVVNEEGSHDSVGGLLVEDLERGELLHSFEGSSELLVAEDRGSGGGGSNVGGNGDAIYS